MIAYKMRIRLSYAELKAQKDLCVKMRLIFFGRIKTTKIIVCKMGIRLFYADFKKYKRFYVNKLRFFWGIKTIK